MASSIPSLARAAAVGGGAMAAEQIRASPVSSSASVLRSSPSSPSSLLLFKSRPLCFSSFFGVKNRGYGYDSRGRQFLRTLIVSQSFPGLGGGAYNFDNESSSNNNDVSDNLTSFASGVRLKKKKSIFLRVLEDIELLDTVEIGRDASLDSMDAMKRTISGMLGVLPSDQFGITVETSNGPLAQLLLSAIMTGYTLRNAEYRLCLQKSLNLSNDDFTSPCFLEKNENVSDESSSNNSTLERTQGVLNDHSPTEVNLPNSLGQLSKEAEQYINELQFKLETANRELASWKKHRGLEIGGLIDEEKNELLNYLRSLDAEKITALSKPTSEEVEEAISQFIEGMVGSLSLQRPAAGKNSLKDFSGPQGGQKIGSGNYFINNDPGMLCTNIKASRDYLARLLFWCMLVGNYLRGVEYRFELSRALRL